jgi:hemerythrin
MTKEMLTGIQIMDKQHKIFLELCDNLDRSVNLRREKNEIMADIKFLKDYAGTHFETERNIMDRVNYAEKEGHLKLHAYFMDELDDMKKKAASGETGAEFAKEIKEKISDWFVLHIIKTDRKLGKFADIL